jgi:hypothetical protein
LRSSSVGFFPHGGLFEQESGWTQGVVNDGLSPVVAMRSHSEL